MKLNEARKFLTAVLGVAVLAATQALGADSPWVVVVVSLADALAVYLVPNARPPVRKAAAKKAPVKKQP